MYEQKRLRKDFAQGAASLAQAKMFSEQVLESPNRGMWLASLADLNANRRWTQDTTEYVLFSLYKFVPWTCHPSGSVILHPNPCSCSSCRAVLQALVQSLLQHHPYHERLGNKNLAQRWICYKNGRATGLVSTLVHCISPTHDSNTLHIPW